MDKTDKPMLPLPDKKIPFSIMVIGTFEIAVALLGLIILLLNGSFDGNSAAFLVLVLIYGTIGAGLWAIQEWARLTNVVLHTIYVPYIFYISRLPDGPETWQLTTQMLISLSIIIALTRPEIQHKFKTVVPKKKVH